MPRRRRSMRRVERLVCVQGGPRTGAAAGRVGRTVANSCRGKHDAGQRRRLTSLLTSFTTTPWLMSSDSRHRRDERLQMTFALSPAAESNDAAVQSHHECCKSDDWQMKLDERRRMKRVPSTVYWCISVVFCKSKDTLMSTLTYWFLRASAMLKHVIDIDWTSVRPSVCPSVCHTLVLYQNGWIYCHAFFTAR